MLSHFATLLDTLFLVRAYTRGKNEFKKWKLTNELDFMAKIEKLWKDATEILNYKFPFYLCIVF